MELHELLLSDLRKKLDEGEVTAKELADHFLSRIKDKDNELHSHLHVNEGVATDVSNLSDETGGSAFHGIPIGVKDVFCTKGMPTTAASNILKGYVPPYSATAIERLQGAVILGKHNLDEFAMGVSTESSAYGPSKNPWNPEYVPGGSSGGSAAAVAAGLTPVALGTDTGGSIRQPSAMCGVVGFKPTYGRISRYGVIAMCSSFDTVGIIGRSVADIAYTFDELVGPDGFDTTVIDAPKNPVSPEIIELHNAQKEDNRIGQPAGEAHNGLRIGIPKEYFETEGLSDEVRASVEVAIKAMEAEGATIKEVSLPHTNYAVPAYYIISPSEVSSNLARYDGIRYGVGVEKAESIDDAFRKAREVGLGAEAKRRIMIGTYALSAGYFDAFYIKAAKVRAMIKEDFDRVFTEVDVLVTPTAPTTAWKFGEKADPVSLYLADVFTAPASLAGVPAISVPCGVDGNGLPIGLQLIGKQEEDGALLRFANMHMLLNPFKEKPATF